MVGQAETRGLFCAARRRVNESERRRARLHILPADAKHAEQRMGEPQARKIHLERLLHVQLYTVL